MDSLGLGLTFVTAFLLIEVVFGYILAHCAVEV
jgi:hypothetical protein